MDFTGVCVQAGPCAQDTDPRYGVDETPRGTSRERGGGAVLPWE